MKSIQNSTRTGGDGRSLNCQHPSTCHMDLLKSFLYICVFGLLLHKVSLQDVNVAEGVTGGSVVLPCATNQTEHQLSNINVHWRHNGSLMVFDILHGNGSVEKQDSGYKNRAETFSPEYEKGNFSLKLNNLAHTDAGHYQCFILHSSEQVITQLIINDTAVETGEQPTAENKNTARETRLWMILTVLGVFILLCLVLCIKFYIIWKKGSGEARPDRNLSCRYLSHENSVLCKESNGDGRENNGNGREIIGNGRESDGNGREIIGNGRESNHLTTTLLPS